MKNAPFLFYSPMQVRMPAENSAHIFPSMLALDLSPKKDSVGPHIFPQMQVPLASVVRAESKNRWGFPPSDVFVLLMDSSTFLVTVVNQLKIQPTYFNFFRKRQEGKFAPLYFRSTNFALAYAFSSDFRSV
jgi:hypothetical protein